MSDEEYEPVEFNGDSPLQPKWRGSSPGHLKRKPPPTTPKPKVTHYEPVVPPKDKPPAPPPLSTLPNKATKQLSVPIATPPPVPGTQRPKIPGLGNTPPGSPTRSRKVTSETKQSHSFDHGMLNRVVSPEGEVYSLAKFVEKYSRSLPLRVRVDKGYCGAEERFVISAGDVYNIHFLKRTKVVTICDSNGNDYSIPMNSAIEFGVLYDPNQNTVEAQKGMVFKKAGDIVARCQSGAPLPRIVCATKTHPGGDPKSSVEENELLLIKKMGKTTMMRKPVLKVYSLTMKEEKNLHEDCAGYFTTDPYRVRLYPPEILAHLSEFLPLKSKLFISFDTSEELPVHLISDVVTLLHSSTETSLIATTCWEGGIAPTDEDRVPVDIPLSLDIEVVIIPVEGNEKLFMDTRNLYEGFDPSKVLTWKQSKDADSFTAQTSLSRAVRQGYEKEGLELQKPQRIYDVPQIGRPRPLPIPSTSPPVPSTSPPTPTMSPPIPVTSTVERRRAYTSVSESTDCSPASRSGGQISKSTPLESPTFKKPTAIPAKTTKSEIKSAQGSSSDSNITQQITSLQAGQKSFRSLLEAQQENMRKQISDIKSNIKKVSSTVEDLSKELKKLQQELNQVQEKMAVSSAHQNGSPPTLGTATPTSEADSRKFLLSLSPVQVWCSSNLRGFVSLLSGLLHFQFLTTLPYCEMSTDWRCRKAWE